jgi:hypothetical protein
MWEYKMIGLVIYSYCCNISLLASSPKNQPSIIGGKYLILLKCLDAEQRALYQHTIVVCWVQRKGLVEPDHTWISTMKRVCCSLFWSYRALQLMTDDWWQIIPIGGTVDAIHVIEWERTMIPQCICWKWWAIFNVSSFFVQFYSIASHFVNARTWSCVVRKFDNSQTDTTTYYRLKSPYSL